MTTVSVLPITHTPPTDASSAVEIPAVIKRHLGLDDARSWVVVAEGNEFDWPGYDLRKIGHAEHYDYGFLPPQFFLTILDAFMSWLRSKKAKLTPRE